MSKDLRSVVQEILNKLVGKVNKNGYRISKLDVLNGLEVEVTRNKKVVFEYRFNGKEEITNFKSGDYTYTGFSDIAIDQYFIFDNSDELIREIDLIDFIEEAESLISII